MKMKMKKNLKFKHDELVSAIQKDIRRNNPDQLLGWIDEWGYSNNLLWDNIMKMLCEDIGVGSPQLPYYVWNMYISRDTTKGCADTNGDTTKANGGVNDLRDVATVMAQCTKTRLNSHIESSLFKDRSNFKWSGMFVPEEDVVEVGVGATFNKKISYKHAFILFQKSFRKCASITASKYNQNNFNPIDQYRVFFWSGYLWENTDYRKQMWNLVLEISNIFNVNGNVVGGNVNALYEIYNKWGWCVCFIQAVVYLTQPVDWEIAIPNPSTSKAKCPKQIPKYALDIYTEEGKNIIAKIKEGYNWSSSRCAVYKVKQFYKNGAMVIPKYSIPFEGYSKIALKLDICRNNGVKKCKNMKAVFDGCLNNKSKSGSPILNTLNKNVRFKFDNNITQEKRIIDFDNSSVIVNVIQRNGKELGKTNISTADIDGWSPQSNISTKYVFNRVYKNLDLAMMRVPGYRDTMVILKGPYTKDYKHTGNFQCFIDSLKPYCQLHALGIGRIKTTEGCFLFFKNIPRGDDIAGTLDSKVGYTDLNQWLNNNPKDVENINILRGVARVFIFREIFGYTSTIVVENISRNIYSIDEFKSNNVVGWEKPNHVKKKLWNYVHGWCSTPQGKKKIYDLLHNIDKLIHSKYIVSMINKYKLDTNYIHFHKRLQTLKIILNKIQLQ